MEDAKYLLGAICDHSSITKLDLSANFFDAEIGVEILRMIIGNIGGIIEHLGMSHNNLQTSGRLVAEFLSTNPPLKVLTLKDAMLNEEDVILIADALKRNNILEELCIGESNIWETGCKEALQNAICDYTSLESIANSNNTCHIVDLDIEFRNSSPFGSSTIKNNKLCHFMNKLNTEGNLVHHLNNEFGEEPLKLTPWVLRILCRYNSFWAVPDLVMRLTCLYGILRGWQMPDLFGTQRVALSDLDQAEHRRQLKGDIMRQIQKRI